MTTPIDIIVREGDRVTINGKPYIVGLVPWKPAEHRAVLELFVPGGRDDPTSEATRVR